MLLTSFSTRQKVVPKRTSLEQKNEQRAYWIIAMLIGIALLSVLLSTVVGAYALSWEELIRLFFAWTGYTTVPEESSIYLLWQIRLPRIVLGLVVGAGLALTGATVQVIFRNPLAEPSLIGISSGAMLAAVSFIVLQNQLLNQLGAVGYSLGLAAAAFLGALLATGLVYRLSTRNGRTQVGVMLLAGIAITALAASLTGLLIFYADEAALRDITFWNLGSLSGARWPIVGMISGVVILAFWQITKQAQQLEILQLGEQEARYLGVEVQAIKRQLIVWIVLVVGTCVAFTGLIGFVGLVVPHLTRLLLPKSSFRVLLIATALLGAALITNADMIARTIVRPAELPIGILTALLGAPFFLFLLIKNNAFNE
ncbi:MAG: FecCD family ABC transporter permease [Aureispira sp.]